MAAHVNLAKLRRHLSKPRRKSFAGFVTRKDLPSPAADDETANAPARVDTTIMAVEGVHEGLISTQGKPIGNAIGLLPSATTRVMVLGVRLYWFLADDLLINAVNTSTRLKSDSLSPYLLKWQIYRTSLRWTGTRINRRCHCLSGTSRTHHTQTL